MIETTILLANTSIDRLEKINDRLIPYKWIYLGLNYNKLIEVEKRLTGHERISIGANLYKTALEERQTYVDWIAEMGKPYGSALHWWTSDLAGRNTENNNLFLNICQLKLALNIVEKTKGSILFVVEDWSLALSLYKALKANGRLVKPIGKPTNWLFVGITGEFFRFFGRWVKGLYVLGRNWLVSRTTATDRGKTRIPSNDGSPRVLLHTCVDESCLGEDGKFKDRYFTLLPQRLKRQGFSVVTIVWPFSFERPMKEVFSYFRGQSDPFVIPEDYFALRDYAAASLTVLRQIFLAADIRKYDGLSIQPLLYKERISQASRAGKVRFLLYTSFIRRLKKAGWSIDYYVDMFENMFCEKPVLLEMHRSFPAAVTLGFQHATISPLMLKYFVNPDEIRRAPNMFPKKIVANGRFFADVLGLCGFAKESICIGPALRYQYLFESGREPKDEEKSVVLVVLPIMTDIAVEIFKRFLDVVEAIPCKIAVKAHPMMNRNTFLRNVGERELPLGCFWAEGSMSEWLPKAFCVVGGATAAVFEAVYAGTPVVLVGRELGLEMNPLGWWEEDVPMFRCCYEKGEMRESILRWITMAPEKGKEEVNKARAVLEGCFQPWEDARVESLFSHSGRYGYA